jgi:hypothetical protein
MASRTSRTDPGLEGGLQSPPDPTGGRGLIEILTGTVVLASSVFKKSFDPQSSPGFDLRSNPSLRKQ